MLAKLIQYYQLLYYMQLSIGKYCFTAFTQVSCFCTAVSWYALNHLLRGHRQRMYNRKQRCSTMLYSPVNSRLVCICSVPAAHAIKPRAADVTHLMLRVPTPTHNCHTYTHTFLSYTHFLCFTPHTLHCIHTHNAHTLLAYATQTSRVVHASTSTACAQE
jgi:hypothetical protein